MFRVMRFICFFSLTFPSAVLAANTFSASLPVGTAVTMGDDRDTLSFTITNNALSTKDIRTVFFNIPTATYNISAATLAPTTCATSWDVVNPASCQLPACISFRKTSGNGITPGMSCAFDIVLTGASGALIPAALFDMTDALAPTSIVAARTITSSQNADFTLTGLPPSWTRKSLAATLSAMPSSIGAGDAITLTMGVVNRSTATQSGVFAVPDPPSRTYSGGAFVNPTGNAIYGSTASTSNPAPTALSSNMNLTIATVQGASTAGFPSEGRLLIDNELIDYTGKAALTFTGCTRGAGGTTAASHQSGVLIYSQNTSAFTLASGEASTITWLFNALSTGTVYFSALASNVTATSRSVNSNSVSIGDFTTQISITPISLISGQNVTVTMIVTNNGPGALTNVSPTLTATGTAALSLVLPAPSNISTLAPGQSGTFQWIYTVTGTVGQTYSFNGFATSGATSSATTASETGQISQYDVKVAPSTVVTGTLSAAFIWTISNRGTASIKTVEISLPPPVTSACGVSKGWGYLSATPPANWTFIATGAPVNLVTFNSNTPINTYGILVGGSKDFAITLNCVPQASADTAYDIPVTLTDRNNLITTINSTITVTADSLTLAAYDDDCVSAAPASKPANGVSSYCLKANLTVAGAAYAGKTVNFTILSGGGTLDNASVVTDASGNAVVILRAPCQATNVSSYVRAELSGSPDIFASLVVPILFTGISGGNIEYLTGSLKKSGGGAPSVASGYSGGFSVDIINCGASALTINASNTTLEDRVGNSFNLLSGVTLNAGASAQLSFAGTVTSSASDCTPTLTINAGAGYVGTYSYYKTPVGDALSGGDTIIVDSGGYCPEIVKVIEWREPR